MIHGLGNDDGTSENHDLDDVRQPVWTSPASKLRYFFGKWDGGQNYSYHKGQAINIIWSQLPEKQS